MHPIIQHTSTKHARIKITSDGEVIFKIPKHQANNQELQQKLLIQAHKMLQKSVKKSHQIIEIQKENSLLVFWEYVKSANISNKKIFLQEQILKKTLPLLEKYSKLIGIPYTKLTFWNYKSKWGSCSFDQKIALNLKLVHLPEKFLEYVIVHEVCHLKIKNHSKEFWKCVESFLPNYQEIRKELQSLRLKNPL